MLSDEQKKKEANDGQYLKVRTKQFALAGCGKTIVARWKFNGPHV
jgi:hypothetical protein